MATTLEQRPGFRSPAGEWQPDLFAALSPDDPSPGGGTDRLVLDPESWVDHVPRWCPDPAATFDSLVASQAWEQPSRVMYDSVVIQPRLSTWQLVGDAGLHPSIGDMARRLSEAYGVQFRSVGVNLYRDGTDSVAWHGDRIGRRRATTTVAIVALGERRPFLVRPLGGGASTQWCSGQGDLLVMGGACQRRWQHCIPKIARAGPRLSVVFREDEREGVVV